MEIGEFFSICFPGFALHQPVDAEVRLPNGAVRRPEVYIDSDGVAYSLWYSVPGDPLGEHTVSASQGRLRGTGTFTVRPASQPGILIPPPNSGPPGTAFRIAVFGFPPNSSVPVYVYKHAEAHGLHDFITTLSVRLNARGETLYNLQTHAGDPRGTYCFLHRGTKAAPEYACGSLSQIVLR